MVGVSACTLIGTLCRFSSRFVAVTITSCTAAAPPEADASAAAVSVAARTGRALTEASSPLTNT